MMCFVLREKNSIQTLFSIIDDEKSKREREREDTQGALFIFFLLRSDIM